MAGEARRAGVRRQHPVPAATVAGREGNIGRHQVRASTVIAVACVKVLVNPFKKLVM